MIKGYRIEELVDPQIHALLGDECWKLFQTDALRGLEWMWLRYGSCTVNNWLWGGDFTESGYRTVSSDYYSPTSMHSVGRAFDQKFKYVTAEEVREDLAKIKYVPFFTRIEDKVNWIHMDTKETNKSELYFFSP